MLIAIDGPAASGKGTVAKMVAKKLGLKYLDTGKLYRAVALVALKESGQWESVNSDYEKLQNDAENAVFIIAPVVSAKVDLEYLGNDELDTEVVGRYASIVSAIPEVRSNLLKFQKDFAKGLPGAVLDGRDIGTVICPEADFKFFITADAKIRAKRRYEQLKLKNPKITEGEVLSDILARDDRDKGRKIAPLQVAEGAHYIDTSELSIDEVFERVCRVIEV